MATTTDTKKKNVFTEPYNVDPMNTGTILGGKTDISNQYLQNLNDMLTGKAFDPLASQMQEAQARAEMQQRGATARDINRFGGVGQGIGQQIAANTEAGLRRDRFDNLISQDVARQNLKLQGMGEARGAYTDDINQRGALIGQQGSLIGQESELLNQEASRFDLDTAKYDKAGSDFATLVQNNTQTKNMTAADVANDVGLMQAGQSLWEAQGGTGQVNPEWVKQEMDKVNDPNLTNPFYQYSNMIDEAVTGGQMTPEEGESAKQLYTALETGVATLEIDENGTLKLKLNEEEQAAADQSTVDSILNGEYTVDQIMSSPERRQLAIDRAQELDISNIGGTKYSKKFNVETIPKENVPFKYGGKTYMMVSKIYNIVGEQFKAKNLETGETITVRADDIDGSFGINKEVETRPVGRDTGVPDPNNVKE